MVLVAVLLVGCPAAAFVPGAICNGANLSTPASELLRGKHIKVQEAQWYPYAYIEDGKWKGMNIEMIGLVAADLGFTYDIQEMVPNATEENWTPMLFREVDKGDLVMSYFLQTTERLERVAMLSGHVDMTAVLVGTLQTAADDTSMSVDRLFSFMRPFSIRLWACLVVMVLLSGVVDFLTERGSESGGHLGESLCEQRVPCAPRTSDLHIPGPDHTWRNDSPVTGRCLSPPPSPLQTSTLRAACGGALITRARSSQLAIRLSWVSSS